VSGGAGSGGAGERGSGGGGGGGGAGELSNWSGGAHAEGMRGSALQHYASGKRQEEVEGETERGAARVR
jgi:hypothetical protein